MNKENRQYLLVGGFVVVGLVIILGVFLWFSAKDRRQYDTYLAVFHDTVDGLTTGAVVKYNGVDIGNVGVINLDSNNPKNVNVYLKILHAIRISTTAYATLKPQGVTGLSYVDLELPKNADITKNLLPHNSAPYPQIPTKISLFASLTEHAQTVSTNIQDISTQVKAALNQDNIQHLNNILTNMDKISSSVASRSADIGRSLDSLAKIIVNVQQNTQNLNQTVQDIGRLTHSLATTSENANSVITNLRDTTLQNIDSVLLPNLNQAIINLNQSSYQLEDLLMLLNQNPSALIRGRKQSQPGPGE